MSSARKTLPIAPWPSRSSSLKRLRMRPFHFGGLPGRAGVDEGDASDAPSSDAWPADAVNDADASAADTDPGTGPSVGAMACAPGTLPQPAKPARAGPSAVRATARSDHSRASDKVTPLPAETKQFLPAAQARLCQRLTEAHEAKR